MSLLTFLHVNFSLFLHSYIFTFVMYLIQSVRGSISANSLKKLFISCPLVSLDICVVDYVYFPLNMNVLWNL